MLGPRVPSRPRLPLELGSIVLAVACSVTLAPASRVRPMNLEEMTARAERIFHGRCTTVERVRDEDPGLDVIRVTFEVERRVKGSAPAQITVRMLADPAVAARNAGDGGTLRFRPGERIVLFLYGESRSGLTSPVGLGQGKFTVLEDKQGREVAVNGFGNEVLFRGLSPEAATRLGDQADAWRHREGIPPETLLRMVETLAP